MSRLAPIVLIHVPKSAGSSLQKMLEESVGTDAVCKTHTLGRISWEEWNNHRVFSGHFDFSQAKSAPFTPRLITMLRDPIERITSLYWYTRSITTAEFERTREPIVAFAKSVGMDEFFYLAPDYVRAHFQNYATRLIVGATFFEGLFGFNLPDADIVRIAKERLTDMTAFGLAERFEESTRHMFATLGLRFPGEQRVNVLEERMVDGSADRLETSRPSAHLNEYLAQVTAIDQQVYDFAATLLEDRIVKGVDAALSEVREH